MERFLLLVLCSTFFYDETIESAVASDADVEPPGIGVGVESIGIPSSESTFEGVGEYSGAAAVSPHFSGDDELLSLRPGWRRHVDPRLSYEIRHDDNVLFSPLSQESDFVHSLDLGISLSSLDPVDSTGEGSDASATISGSYDGGVEIFQNGTAKDAFHHALSINGAGSFRRFRLNAAYAFVSALTPTIEEGGRVRRISHSPLISIEFDVASKLKSLVSFRFIDTSVARNIDTERFSGDFWLDYQVASRSQLGVGGAVGVDHPSIGVSSVFEQTRARFRYNASNRIQLQLRGGLELRQFDGDGGDIVAPIFGLGLTYEVTRTTTLTLSGDRGFRPSNFIPGQILEDIRGTISLQQRFFQQYFFQTTFSLGESSFRTTGATVIPFADQTYTIFSASVWREFVWGLRAEVFFRQSERESNLRSNGLDNNLSGLRFVYNFK